MPAFPAAYGYSLIFFYCLSLRLPRACSLVIPGYETKFLYAWESHTAKDVSCFNNLLIAQFLYSITICMLHYNPRHVSSINIPIFRMTNCIITASGIVTLCKRLYSMPDESSRLQRVTLPNAVIELFRNLVAHGDAREGK